MGRIRTIKPEFPQSESIGRLSRDARLLFLQLWTFADDSGRARASSRILASLLYPYDDDAFGLIDSWLSELEREKHIRRYVVEGNSYLEIFNWLKHQKIDKPSASRIPEFVESSSNPRRSVDDGPRKGPRTKDKDRDLSSSRGKREGDPRHAQFKSLLSAYWEFSNPGSEMPWDGSAAGALGSLLKASPNLSAEQFKKCLYNRHLSDGINTSERPTQWICKVTNYANTPLDKFNHPKNGATNGYATKGDERERSIKQTLARALEEMGSEEAGQDDGVLPLGVTGH
jgi:hypothetical protein